MTVTNERTLNVRAKDKPRQMNTKIWHKAGKNPKMGKTLDQFFLLLFSNVQQRMREYILCQHCLVNVITRIIVQNPNKHPKQIYILKPQFVLISGHQQIKHRQKIGSYNTFSMLRPYFCDLCLQEIERSELVIATIQALSVYLIHGDKSCSLRY